MEAEKDRGDVVIVGAARTPNGRLRGGLAACTATELGAIAIRGALSAADIDPSEVDTCIMGNVLQAGLGQCPARQAAIGAGLGWHVVANTVNRVCLSGLSAIIEAARAIRAGDSQVAVAGGMESMTNAPHILPKSRFGYPFGNTSIVDTMTNDGLSDAWSGEAMGLDTENRLADYPASRAEMDALALRSQQLAARAWSKGEIGAEIVPVTIRGRKGDTVVDTDEGVRAETTIETLGALRPAFRPDGAITAGNSSTVNDGGAAVVLTTRQLAVEKDWPILATIRAAAQVAGPSPALAPQPSNAIEAALERQGWTADQVDIFEINEAFAAVAVTAVNKLAIPLEKVNPQGGAIALGHPIGQSGARLVVHAAHELTRRGGGRAAVALCGGTGQGDALLLEL